MSNRPLCHDDPFIITQREHDPVLGAKRVVIVGGEMPSFNVQGSTSTDTKIQIVEVPTIVKETQIVEVEKVIVKTEVQVVQVEVPVIIEKIVEVIREVPVIQHEIKMVEVPIIVREVQIREMSNLVKGFLAVNSLAITILLIKLILK